MLVPLTLSLKRYMTFSHWVRTRRLEQGLSTHVLSTQTGIPRSTLSALERREGPLSPNLQMLMSIYPVLAAPTVDDRRRVAEMFIRAGGRIDQTTVSDPSVSNLLIGAVERALEVGEISTNAVDNRVDARE